MPTAVIMEENFDKLLEQCEAQELEVSAVLGFFIPLLGVFFDKCFLPALCVWRTR